jgi:thiol peroxidase
MPVIIDAPVRYGPLEIAGKPATIYGDEVTVGQTAPAFTGVVDGWKPVEPLQDSMGKVIVLLAVPSLDTATCDLETRRFNTEASKVSEDVVVYVISTDFPMAQKRWCGNAGVERVLPVSDVLETDFSLKYGLLIKERRYLRRAVFVVDRAGVLRYVAYMPALGVEPDYDDVINAAKGLL